MIKVFLKHTHQVQVLARYLSKCISIVFALLGYSRDVFVGLKSLTTVFLKVIAFVFCPPVRSRQMTGQNLKILCNKNMMKVLLRVPLENSFQSSLYKFDCSFKIINLNIYWPFSFHCHTVYAFY